MKKKIFIIISTSILLVACEKNWDGEAELKQLSKPWKDAMDLAAESPRYALAPQIAKMQELRRQADAIKVSKCMEKPKKIYIDYMQARIDSFTKFLGKESAWEKDFNLAEAKLSEYNASVEECLPKNPALR